MSLVLLVWLLALGASLTAGAQQGGLPSANPQAPPAAGQSDAHAPEAVVLAEAAARLPTAAALGALLAFRLRRRGTPPRNPAVIQTQILLAVVGALVMMVVGTSLARAFGIVGAAGLIRYRAKIEDPKDAGVMLATLGVGLAAGVGLYLLAIFATLFFLLLLGIVESLGSEHKLFDLTIKTDQVSALRPKVEALLQRQGIEFELRSASEDQVCYAVRLPLRRRTDRVSASIVRLAPNHPPAIEWEERKAKS